MSEALIRGLVVGATLGIIWMAVVAIQKLFKSQTEWARRLRIVAGIALMCFIGMIAIEALGAGGAAILAIVVIAGIWVFSGRK